MPRRAAARSRKAVIAGEGSGDRASALSSSSAPIEKSHDGDCDGDFDEGNDEGTGGRSKEKRRPLRM